MSPVHDPNSRSMRRIGRDLAERERRNPEDPRQPGGRRDAPEPDDPSDADLARWTDEELEKMPLRSKHGRRRTDAARRRAAEAVAGDEAEADAPPGDAVLGTVVATSRGPCEVELDDGRRVAAQLPKALARDDRSVVAVGDRVELATRPGGELAVSRRLPRTSRLSRPDPFLPHRERVLVANLDLGVVVASVRQPPLSTGLLDRFLVALRHGGVDVALAINKADLASADDRLEADRLLAPYRALEVPLALCSARTGEGLEAVRGWIARRVVAFVGHSGVGKSSLLNALAPEADATVGAISSHFGKGRHTTTRASVHRLPDGTRIVDTPGVREFGLWRLSPVELAVYFEEFEPFAAACRFADCTHVHEPACAVRDAASRAEISPERFATYQRILASFERE